MKLIGSVKLLLVLGFLVSCGGKKVFYIGSGSEGAIYYPVAQALCENFNKYSEDYKCVALLSKGAKKNLEDLKKSRIDFGISQVPLQEEYYLNEEAKNLRSVMGLHKERFSVVVKKGSRIKSFDDLKGKRVNVGNPDSGSRVYFDKLMASKGWRLSDFSKVHQEHSSGLADLICNNEIDAAVYTVGHPNKIFRKIIDECDGVLLSLSEKDKQDFKKVLPEFQDSVIMGGLYDKQKGKVDTIAIPIILSACGNSDKKLVRELVRYSIDNQEYLEQQNVIFKEITFELSNDLKVPVHKGLESVK